MHPELLNNSLFLRYYQQWQENPQSVVFVPIAEYFIHYGMVEDAIRVCEAGLKNHPDLVLGRISLARALLRKNDSVRARAELKRVLDVVPNQEKALELMAQIEGQSAAEPSAGAASSASTGQLESWQTVTMAKIYARQGHLAQARQVLEAILKHDPQNEEARRGLQNLGTEGA